MGMATTMLNAHSAYTLTCVDCFSPAIYDSDVYRWLIATNGDTLLEVTNQNYCYCADDDTFHAVAVELWLPLSLVS